MIFVTGGTGFLGKHLLRALVLQNEPIRALKRLKRKTETEAFSHGTIEWVDGDILDIPSLEEHMHGCSEIYHCAGMVSFQPRHRAALMKVNAEGTANVVNVALEKNIRKMVYVSSVAAIGRPLQETNVTESTEWDENGIHSNYGISKYLAEREVWRGIAEGLNAVIVNPTVIVGDGSWQEGTPRFFLNGWRGMPAYPTGGSGFVAAKDVAELMIRLMKNDIQHERFILNAEDWSYQKFLFTIADLLGKKRPYIKVLPWMTAFIWRLEAMRALFMKDSPLITRETARITTRSYHFNASKIKAATGFQFTPLITCMEETAEKFKEDVAAGKIK